MGTMTEVTATKFAARPGKYLSFMLADEIYAVGVLCVREIIGLVPITAVPRTPPFIKGVINLRGKIIPVVDLRTKFEMAKREYTRETCIIIVEVTASAGPICIGIIVDLMCEVFDVGQADLEEVPSFGVRVDTSFLLGLSRGKSGVKLLLDIERVLSQEELAATETVKEKAESSAPVTERHTASRTPAENKEQK